MKKSKLGLLIRTKRNTLGLTQLALARKFGWKKAQFVSNIERGMDSWPKSSLPKLAKVLNIPPKTLYAAWDADAQLEFEDVFG